VEGLVHDLWDHFAARGSFHRGGQNGHAMEW
jgi:hypothetical protein